MKRTLTGTYAVASVLAFGLLVLAAAGPLDAEETQRQVIATETLGPDLSFLANLEAELWQLTIVGEGITVQATSQGQPPSAPLEDAEGNALPDGVYQYELRILSSEEESEASATGRPMPLAGTFRVLGGARVVAPLGQAFDQDGTHRESDGSGSSDAGGLRSKRAAVTLALDNSCVGFQCGVSEDYPSLGSAYLKLDGLGQAIIAEDTSTGTFPLRDWQLAFNDRDGSAEFFAVYDLGNTGGFSGARSPSNASSVPFRIDAAAPTDSLRVLASSGNVGMGTATPANDLEIFSDSPTIRLSDDAGTEWNLNNDPQSQEFDIVSTQSGGNPVRHIYVQRSAPADQLMLTSSGIGIGTNAPNATVEIRGNSGTSQMAITEQGADAAVEVMLNLICDCAPAFRMTNTSNGQVWFFRHLSGGDFSFDDPGAAGQEMRLTPTGNLFLRGNLSQGSSRALKENLEPADGEKVLGALANLDLYEWSYLDQDARHFGPMAEDFADAYGLGTSRANLSPGDMAGLALAASKTLMEKNEVLAARSAALESEKAELEARVKELETLLARVAALEEQLQGQQ